MALPAPTNIPPPTTLDLPLPDPEAYEGEPQEYARALMQRRDEIERQVEALNQVLNSHGVNAGTSLLDPEGYPRADIDVWTIRHTRSALARLRTDHRQISNLLVPALEAAFARTSLGSTSTAATAAAASTRLDASERPMMNGHSRSSTGTTAYSLPSSSTTPFASPSTGIGSGTAQTPSPGSTRQHPRRRPLRLRGPAERDREGRDWTSEDEREYHRRAREEAEARGEVWHGDEGEWHGEEEDDEQYEEGGGGRGEMGTPAGDGFTTARPPVAASVSEQDEAWPEGVLARVNTVAPNSPAEQAGLLPNDLIRTFGDIDAPSGRGLTAIGALVIRSEGVTIPLRVERAGQRVTLTLTPRNGWGGRGLLGCHILPP